jgi:hypothetical protein
MFRSMLGELKKGGTQMCRRLLRVKSTIKGSATVWYFIRRMLWTK